MHYLRQNVQKRQLCLQAHFKQTLRAGERKVHIRCRSFLLQIFSKTKSLVQTQIYNNFALDPHRIQMPPANPPPPGTGRHARDASRRDNQNINRRGTLESTEPPRKRTPPPDAKIDPRAGQRMTYQDLDEVAGGEDIALMY